MYEHFFSTIGYKVDKPIHMKYVYKGFQAHTGLVPDGIIGPYTKAMIRKTNHRNFCPEVFEPIKPYIQYTDAEVDAIVATHTAITGAHHTKYTDAEAVSAVSTADTYLLNNAR